MLKFTNWRNCGLIPQCFSLSDPRSARDQLHTAYAHGGGVRPFGGFTLVGNSRVPLKYVLKYSDDPDTHAVGFGKLRDELIVIFDNSWVAIIQPDNSFIVTRCD